MTANCEEGKCIAVAQEKLTVDEIRTQLTRRRLPRWNELPDIGLYMDQVLSLMDSYLEKCLVPGGCGVTASMVNNYVKQGAMPAPVKKKYGREHIARLIVICVLKSALPIASIGRLINADLSQFSQQEAYDIFCDQFEHAGRNAAGAAEAVRNSEQRHVKKMVIIRSILRAQAEQALAQSVLELPQEE